jgi:SAM-dependent methyltransferase
MTWVHELYDDLLADLFLDARPVDEITAWVDYLQKRTPNTQGTQTFLDQGCGVGTIAIPLAKAGASVFGVDITASYIDTARARAAASGVGGGTATGGPPKPTSGTATGGPPKPTSGTATGGPPNVSGSTHWHAGSAATYVPEAPCDGVFTVGTCIGHGDDAETCAIFASAFQALRPGGRYVVEFLGATGVLRNFARQQFLQGNARIGPVTLAS